MPIYEFECAACEKRFDRLQKLSDPDPTTCPTCGAERVRRRLTAPAFRLSGSGWYETDFKKDGDKKRNLAGAEKAAENKSESAKSDAAAGKSDANAKPAGSASETAKSATPAKSGAAPVNNG